MTDKEEVGWFAVEENKRTHLQMLQAVINRMAANSFHLKGWSVVLVAALFALAAGDSEKAFIYLAYFPALAFWGLDGYFLRQGRLFRKLYDRVRLLEPEKVDFSMDTSVVASEVNSWLKVVFSKTLRSLITPRFTGRCYYRLLSSCSRLVIADRRSNGASSLFQFSLSARHLESESDTQYSERDRLFSGGLSGCVDLGRCQEEGR